MISSCLFFGSLATVNREDHWCRDAHSDGKLLCENCWLPICTDCFTHLSQAKLPPLSYANDMWTGYGLEMVYSRQVTIIELLCASPCLASMVLMSMESKHRQEPTTAVFDEVAHMARHRYGARGNVITFPLPMEALLQQLQEHANMPDQADHLPRSGEELSEIFRVIFKTNKTGKATDEEIKTLLHQATARREDRAHTGRLQVVVTQEYKSRFLHPYMPCGGVLYACMGAPLPYTRAKLRL